MVDQYDISLEKGLRGASLRKNKRRGTTNGPVWFYLGLVGQIGYTVAIPLAGGAIVGSFIDRTLGTGTKGALVGLAIGFIVSIVGFVRVIKEAMKK